MELISQTTFIITLANHPSLCFEAGLLAVALAHVTGTNLSQTTSGRLYNKSGPAGLASRGLSDSVMNSTPHSGLNHCYSLIGFAPL